MPPSRSSTTSPHSSHYSGSPAGSSFCLPSTIHMARAPVPGPLPSRQSTGCWTCRLRRKKCSDSHDGSHDCEECVRLEIKCMRWTEIRPQWMKNKTAVAAWRSEMKEEVRIARAAHKATPPETPYIRIGAASSSSHSRNGSRGIDEANSSDSGPRKGHLPLFKPYDAQLEYSSGPLDFDFGYGEQFSDYFSTPPTQSSENHLKPSFYECTPSTQSNYWDTQDFFPIGQWHNVSLNSHGQHVYISETASYDQWTSADWSSGSSSSSYHC